jgi:hypothetical protein
MRRLLMNIFIHAYQVTEISSYLSLQNWKDGSKIDNSLRIKEI